MCNTEWYKFFPLSLEAKEPIPCLSIQVPRKQWKEEERGTVHGGHHWELLVCQICPRSTGHHRRQGGMLLVLAGIWNRMACKRQAGSKSGASMLCKFLLSQSDVIFWLIGKSLLQNTCDNLKLYLGIVTETFRSPWAIQQPWNQLILFSCTVWVKTDSTWMKFYLRIK